MTQPNQLQRLEQSLLINNYVVKGKDDFKNKRQKFVGRIKSQKINRKREIQHIILSQNLSVIKDHDSWKKKDVFQKGLKDSKKEVRPNFILKNGSVSKERSQSIKKTNKSSKKSSPSSKKLNSMNEDERKHLKDLYNKRSTLLQKLKKVNKKEKIKTQQNSIDYSASKNISTSQKMQNQRKSFLVHHSRYLNHSSEQLVKKNMRYRYQSPPSIPHKKQKIPESVSSSQKNRSILTFIAKMHRQSVDRDLSRIKFFHKKVEEDLKIQIHQKQIGINKRRVNDFKQS